MSHDDPVGEAARTELTRQAIILAFGIVGLVVMAYAQRHATDPDMMRTHKMRASKRAERSWARIAAWSWARAEEARRAYERDCA
jgi:hypothetical protein